MSYSTYNSDDVIDLEHAFDEDRMTHYSTTSSNNNYNLKPHRISLQSVDDDVIKNLHRSLITPLPPRVRGYSNKEDEEEGDDDIWYHEYPNRPESRTESVMLFKNIDNGNEPVTVDFVSSDLNEFMNPYTEDDLMSRPPSRMPQKRRDSLNRFLKTSLMEKPSFAKPRSKERSAHSLHQTNKENSDEERRRRRDPLHAKSYTDLSVIQRKESKKDNNHMESSLRSLKASVNNLIISSTISNEEDNEEYVESPIALQQSDVIRKRLETRNNPEKLRKRYSYNVDHSNVPENPRHAIKDSDKATRRWSSFIPDQQDKVKPSRQSTLQQKKSCIDLNYPIISEPSRDDWENQVSDPPPIQKTLQRPVRITSYQYRTDNNKQLSPPSTATASTRYRKYSNPSKAVDDYKPTNNVTSIPKRTSKLYELATQREPKQQQKPFMSKVTPIVASRSSGELSNSTESSSNSGDMYYDTPPSPPSDRVAFISARTRELSLREPKYRIRTLSEEERMPPRNNLRSKKLSLDSQKPSVTENARQVLEMVRQRRQQAMSRTH